jgi:hypothetical protein
MSNVRSFGTSHNPKPTTTSAKTTALFTNRLLHLRVPASAARGPHRSGVPPIAGFMRALVENGRWARSLVQGSGGRQQKDALNCATFAIASRTSGGQFSVS